MSQARGGQRLAPGPRRRRPALRLGARPAAVKSRPVSPGRVVASQQRHQHDVQHQHHVAARHVADTRRVERPRRVGKSDVR